MKNAPHDAPASSQETLSDAQPSASQDTFFVPTSIHVGNSTATAQVQIGDNILAHPIPTLDGSGLLVVAGLLGVAALWLWRRQQ